MIQEVLAFYEERGLDPGYQGEFEARYCEAFSNYLGGGHADAVATGTVAVYVAIAAASLPQGSEVLVSPITDSGTLSAILMNGLVPRPVDSGVNSFNVTSATVRDALTDNTSAAVLVHCAGQAISDIAEIASLLRDSGIKLIEDCSQSHGAEVSGAKVGTFGDISAFSTMYRKAHITGASGGVVFSRDENLYRMALAHADRGKPTWEPGFDFRDPRKFLFPALNLHTDEISCGIGLASLARLDEVRQARLRYVAAVCDALDEIAGVASYGYSGDDSPFFQPVMVESGAIKCDKTSFAEAVMAEGIAINPHYRYLIVDWPWLTPYFSTPVDTPNARHVIDNSFNLYVNEKYDDAEAKDTIAAIKKVSEYFGIA